MDTVLANMNGCKIEHEALMIEQYGEEAMFAGWNPQLTQAPVAQINKHVNLLADLAGADVDAFLKRLYEYQR